MKIKVFDQQYAMEQYGKKEREEGREEGRAEGRVEGREEGRVEGREEGRVENMESNIRTVMKKMNCSVQKAMDFLDIAKEEQARYAVLLKETAADRE